MVRALQGRGGGILVLYCRVSTLSGGGMRWGGVGSWGHVLVCGPGRSISDGL